ncbi:hypothetical protein MHU86_9787 [Fragilaria crotonensis]|nr:hypothetical protein MHU86_9787 [Fragilaria crotonensis]
MEESTESNAASLYHEEFQPPFLPLLVLVPFLLPAFWTYSVDVTEELLSFGYSWNMARKSAARSQIVSATQVPEIRGLTQWGGWGIRYNLKGDTGYIVKDGPGVRITVLNQNQKEQVYFFNCSDPEKVCKLLNLPPKE